MKILIGYVLLACLNHHIEGQSSKLKYYEFGTHVPGEVNGSFHTILDIPAFKPKYYVLLEITDENVKKNFTHLHVGYWNPVSQVIVNYNPQMLQLEFFITMPFMETVVEIVGSSMPISIERAEKFKNYMDSFEVTPVPTTKNSSNFLSTMVSNRHDETYMKILNTSSAINTDSSRQNYSTSRAVMVLKTKMQTRTMSTVTATPIVKPKTSR